MGTCEKLVTDILVPPVQCSCGGLAYIHCKEGRFFSSVTRPGILFLIPEDMPIHRCRTCSTDLLDELGQKLVQDFVEAAYFEHERMILRAASEFRNHTGRAPS